MSRVLTVGTFDLWHKGHINLLRTCYKIAGATEKMDRNHAVIVGLNTDEFIQQFKGKKPVQTYAERYSPIITCKYVYEVTKNIDGDDLKPLLSRVTPDFLVVGSDWAKKDYYAQISASKEWLQKLKIKLLYVEYTEGISSTTLKERILSGES